MSGPNISQYFANTADSTNSSFFEGISREFVFYGINDVKHLSHMRISRNTNHRFTFNIYRGSHLSR